ncbi:hypothetical protein ABE867_10805 [Enterococcus gallinarum]|uniref:hypothetical protein n=1 Tax=Enterococcus gallinarum TaxID=1353 RepID=UPI001D831427|nr:hypothetical protein [Enterococcus gallinarum]
MVQRIKKWLVTFAQTTPFLLSNTVIVIPYLLFLGLNDGKSWLTILPFTLFYTLRMTGIFLIRSIRLGLDSYTLLIGALLMGGVGAFAGVLGVYYFPFFYLSGSLLGLSASWLVPTNRTVNLHEKNLGFINMTRKKVPFALFLLILLLVVMEWSGTTKLIAAFGLYTMFYVMAYHTVTHYPRYSIDFKQMNSKVIAFKELLLFLIFFLLLFLLRNARLLANIQLLDWAIYGFFFLFLGAVFYLGRAKKHWKLPSWLNVLTFLNGMLGNFVFLFGALYLGSLHGTEALTRYLYLPYLGGMILSMILGKRILQGISPNTVPVLLGGLALSLFVLLFPQSFVLGLFLLSFWQSLTSSWLNQRYAQEPSLPVDQRMIAKFTTQNKGSVTHQFVMMAFLLIMTTLFDRPMNILLQLSGNDPLSSPDLHVLNDAKWLNCGILMVAVIVVYILWKKNHSTGESDETIKTNDDFPLE